MLIRYRFVAAALIALCAIARAESAEQTQWYTLSVDGVRTGYARNDRESDAGGITEREIIDLYMRQLGHNSRFEQRTEFRRTAIGDPAAFEYALTSGTVRTQWHGTFEGTFLRVRSSDRRQSGLLDLPADTMFTPSHSERLAPLWRDHQNTMTALVFDPTRRTSGLLRARRVVDENDAEVHIRMSGAGTSAEDIWFDDDGHVLRLETDAFGARVTWTPCARECDAHVDTPMDVMDRLVVRSPVRIPASYKQRMIRYVLARSDGAQPRLAATSEQAVAFEDAHAIVTICATCGAAEHPTSTGLQRYLAPNSWVRSDDPEIRGLALNTVVRGASVDYRMRKLADLVLRRMRGSNDFLGYADAVTALHTGSGDCTEFAVLLAAFARAQGIPARIALGLAYSDRFSGKKDVFSPHAWVQAWDGARWKSYDAALDGFDSTHIAIALGTGDPDEVDKLMMQLPLLRIEKAGVVRER